MIYKCDLRKAYRQFYVDPYDFPLLGFHWNDCYYFDVVLPMGLRSAAMACQRITSGISYVCSQQGFDVLNYLDDFQGVEVPDNAATAFCFLQSLLIELGVEESKSKACPPTTRATCLGVEFDTLAMTKSIHTDRLIEIQELLRQWSSKTKATKRELQSLLGKLSFVSKCVQNSRIFLMRIIDLLKRLKRNHHRVSLNKDFRKDISWWINFIAVYNGVSIICDVPWSAPDCVFATDACLTGCGGVCGRSVFHAPFPDWVLQQFTAIHQLEFLAFLVAVRLWGALWAGLRVQVYCDNAAVVTVINSGKTSDSLMGTILRNTWLQVSAQEFEIRAVHLPGVTNRLADYLSRWHLDEAKYSGLFAAECGVWVLLGRRMSLMSYLHSIVICNFCSIRNYLSGVKLMHLIAGFDFPFLQSYEVRLTLKGIQRTIKHTPNQAPPITPAILSKLVSVIDLDDGKEVTFMCAFLLTFFLFARVSNIVPQVASRFDKVQHLCRGDIFECRAGLLVLFKWSKTIQFGERRFMLPLVRLENSPLCPVAMYLRMIRFYPAPPSAPAFTYSSRKDIFVSVHKGEFITFLRAKLALAGVSFPHLYRFRRGAASFAFRSGVPGELIQNFGDWASDAYKTYLEISLPVKVQVAEQMKLHILQHTSVV